jgi:hypothetical protein
MKNHGSLEDFRLVLHGTAEAPHHMKAGPRIYDENYNTVQNERSVRTNSQTTDILLISVFFFRKNVKV